MSKNIYVGNLSFETTADDLIELFGAHGTDRRLLSIAAAIEQIVSPGGPE